MVGKSQYGGKKEEIFEEVYNLPSNVFKPKKSKKDEVIPVQELPQSQMIVDDDFIEKAFEMESNNSPLKSKSPTKLESSPLKSPEKSTNLDISTKSPKKEVSNIDSPSKSPTKQGNLQSKEESPLKKSDPQVHSLIKSPLKTAVFSTLNEPNEEDFQITNSRNDKESGEESEEKEEEQQSEGNEVYEVDDEENQVEEDLSAANDEEEPYIEQDGLKDILEASNENSEGINGGEIKDFNEDSIQEEEKNGTNVENLRSKYEEAIRREKELKNIIELKVKECVKVLGKPVYEEIIEFFRGKLNVLYLFF